MDGFPFLIFYHLFSISFLFLETSGGTSWARAFIFWITQHHRLQSITPFIIHHCTTYPRLLSRRREKRRSMTKVFQRIIIFIIHIPQQPRRRRRTTMRAVPPTTSDERSPALHQDRHTHTPIPPLIRLAGRRLGPSCHRTAYPLIRLEESSGTFSKAEEGYGDQKRPAGRNGHRAPTGCGGRGGQQGNDGIGGQVGGGPKDSAEIHGQDTDTPSEPCPLAAQPTSCIRPLNPTQPADRQYRNPFFPSPQFPPVSISLSFSLFCTCVIM